MTSAEFSDSFAQRISPAQLVEIDAVVQECGIQAYHLAEQVFQQFNVPSHQQIRFVADLADTLEFYALRKLVGKLLDPKKADVKAFEKMTDYAPQDLETKLNVLGGANEGDEDFVQRTIKHLLAEMDKIIEAVKIPANAQSKDNV